MELKAKLSDYMLRYPHYPNVNSIISYISLLSSNVIPNQEYESIYRNLESLIQEYRVYIYISFILFLIIRHIFIIILK